MVYANQDYSENFRQNVRTAIAWRDSTFAELAERVGIARPGLSRLVNGHQEATIPHAAKIANALNIPLFELLKPPAEFRAFLRARMSKTLTAAS